MIALVVKLLLVPQHLLTFLQVKHLTLAHGGCTAAAELAHLCRPDFLGREGARLEVVDIDGGARILVADDRSALCIVRPMGRRDEAAVLLEAIGNGRYRLHLRVGRCVEGGLVLVLVVVGVASGDGNHLD